MENSLKRFIQIKNLQKWQVEAIEVKQGLPNSVNLENIKVHQNWWKLIEINRFSPFGETRLTENQGVTKSSQDDKWTSPKIGVSPSETVSPNSGGS